VIARDSYGGALGARHDMGTESKALNSLAHPRNFLFGGVRAHYD
jgi:hypothetical protein